MSMNKPPFTLTDKMVNLIAEITEKLGRLEESNKLENNLHLRRENRIKTIKSTTAIENNTLSLKQVTDVVNGKIVIGKSDEITEVANSFISYEKIPEYNPYTIKSFLQAHKYITTALLKASGKFRSGDVGVFDDDKVIHMGARPEFVNDLIKELFEWAKNTDTHPLIVSAVVHYEIEYIHPFEDGNGRIGRLWQTTILSKWKPVFEYIPIETIVYKYQQDYYDAISLSRKDNSSNKFILFMLDAINESLDEFDDIEITDIVTDIVTDKLSPMELKVLNPIIKYLLKRETIDNKKAQALTNKSAGSIKKYLNTFAELGILIKIGENKGRKYKLNEATLKSE
jgi:Uncharacterized conserved protein